MNSNKETHCEQHHQNNWILSLNLESIAILGASDRPGKWGYEMVERPLNTGFRGTIYPVNPNKKDILGLPSYRSILDIPDQIDLAVIVAPAATTPKLMQECVAKQVKGAIVISAGFAEAGKEGKALEDRGGKNSQGRKNTICGPQLHGNMECRWKAQSLL